MNTASLPEILADHVATVSNEIDGGSDEQAAARESLAAIVNALVGARGRCDALNARPDLAAFFNEKREWSRVTFGPHQSAVGVLAHIRKELLEIERDPSDLVEWIDVVLLVMDGAWRATGADGRAFVDALVAKQAKNYRREWPKQADPDVPIEHVRAADEAVTTPGADVEELRWAARVKLVEARVERAIAVLRGAP